jgi:hypothetical protein
MRRKTVSLGLELNRELPLNPWREKGWYSCTPNQPEDARMREKNLSETVTGKGKIADGERHCS